MFHIKSFFFHWLRSGIKRFIEDFYRVLTTNTKMNEIMRNPHFLGGVSLFTVTRPIDLFLEVCKKVKEKAVLFLMQLY